MTAAMVTLTCLAATSALGQSATSRTQDVARMPNGKPDFSGVWDHPRVVDVTRDGNACGGGTRGRAWPPASPPPAVVKDLQVPENPYRIIYNPPVDLAKAPDTTAHGRKPRS